MFPLFCVSYFLIIIVLILQFIPRYKTQIRSNRYFPLLIGIILIMSSIIIVYLKQYEGYYLLPALLFTMVGLFAVNEIFYELFPRFFKFNKYIYIYVIFIAFLIPQIKDFKNAVGWFSSRKEASYKTVKFLNNSSFNQSIIVSTDRTSSMPTALSKWFG